MECMITDRTMASNSNGIPIVRYSSMSSNIDDSEPPTEENVTETSNWFVRARREQQITQGIAAHLRMLTPLIIDAITPPVVSHTRNSIVRDHEGGYNDLWNRYFSPNAMYLDAIFRRRFRMRRSLFFRIQADLELNEPYFVQRRNAAGRLGLHSLQKITVALRMLAYGVPADSIDESLQVAETTAILSMKMFCAAITRLYMSEYLREPTRNDLDRLLQEGEHRGFPGMIGSLDCMHWVWKNCPTAWHGQYRGHHGKPTLILEAVASQDLWIWHAFFGMAGSNNDITVLDHSPLFNTFLHGLDSDHLFYVNGNEYNKPYFLTDGIYPSWSTLIQSVSSPRTEKEKHFARTQEGVRKDVERAFGVLQAKWAIIKGSARFWKVNELRDIMLTCIILHNMIIDDERHSNLERWTPLSREPPSSSSYEGGDPAVIGAFLDARMWALRDHASNRQLKMDLIQHLWDRKGLDDGA